MIHNVEGQFEGVVFAPTIADDERLRSLAIAFRRCTGTVTTYEVFFEGWIGGVYEREEQALADLQILKEMKIITYYEIAEKDMGCTGWGDVLPF